MSTIMELSAATLSADAKGAQAAAGTNQGNATLLTQPVTVVSGADGTKGVILPAATVGLNYIVMNSSSTLYLSVYPAVGEFLSTNANGAQAVNLGVSICPGGMGKFYCPVDGTWYAQHGVEWPGNNSDWNIGLGKLTCGKFAGTAGNLAGAGTNQSNAGQITTNITNGTGADGTVGIKLPTIVAGEVYTVYNSHATNALKIYAQGTETINGTIGSTAYSLAALTGVTFTAVSATSWTAIKSA